ncbi:type II secretion system F family protein [Yimella sp. cx-51]|uniref:type II secretion system F family protein n=1 Tax=Yimella sp. cx-51 TaxID=2770551 RepID=UPI00165EA913|nr:type II secretion system F family protein [Yimella sp. cx-51]MBC9956099.1 type II secretion system F family protein [Yimella sp. cx-51]MBD2758265.1 type II secretion system F family protein [Yimella sp. cx-573]QTH39640.1 type II secretion system F family protein [Yimella sp. cx-51]
MGVFCIYWSFWPRIERPVRSRETATDRLRADLALSDIRGFTVRTLLLGCFGCASFVFLVAMAATGVAPVALCFAALAGYAPVAWVRGRAQRRRHNRRELWPDAVDHISSAVRAGLALPEALAQLAIRGPEELRPAFAGFAHDYRTTGDFQGCLDDLKARLADPVADRLIESLRLAREVGGTDLGRLLRTLSTFLRDDARTRAELEARQSWTVNAARLALVAPWLVLLMLATRGDSLRAYSSPTGVAVLVIGGGVSFLAYRLMRRIGRLPAEVRVMA